MTITVYTLEKADKEIRVFFVSEFAEDFSETIYQEYETEGWQVSNWYSQDVSGWNRSFIQKVWNSPFHMYTEEMPMEGLDPSGVGPVPHVH